MVTLGNAHLPIVLLNSSMNLVPTLESSLLLLLRRHSNLFPPLTNLNYEIYFSYAYPLPGAGIYSTLNIVSLAYILKSVFEGRKLENSDRLLRFPF